MSRIQIIGIKDLKYEALLNSVNTFIKALPGPVDIEEVNEIDQIMRFDILSIPALVTDDQLIWKALLHLPNSQTDATEMPIYFRKTPFMKNILIPTDFSENAKNAYRYALEVAAHLKANVNVVNIVHPPLDAMDPVVSDSLGRLMEIREKQLSEFCSESIENYKKPELPSSIQHKEVLLGFATEQLVHLSKSESTDLVIMGSTGERGWLKKMFGGVASHVGRHAACPVMLIPENAHFNGLQHIIYASNYESVSAAMLEKIFAFAELFNAKVHLVHVNEAGKKSEEQEALILERINKFVSQKDKIEMTFVDDNTVWEGLNQYAKSHDADLIVLAHQQRPVIERIFHHSQTEAVIKNTQLPLLVFHSKD